MEINVPPHGSVCGVFEGRLDNLSQFASLSPDGQANTDVDGEDEQDNEPDRSVEYSDLEKIPPQRDPAP
jgi:hypothetical protein